MDEFAYKPDERAMKLRAVRKAREMLALAEDGKRHQPILSSAEGHLGKLYLYVTFDCPLRCPFCYANGGERKTETLSAARLAEICGEAVALGFREITLVGGEPLVYKEFDALTEALGRMDRKGTKLTLRTSFGFPVKEERLRRIADTFDLVTVSIDGDEERHDSVRGKGVYQKALENIRYCIEQQGAEISICSVMDKADFEGAQGRAVVRLCDELKIGKLTVQSAVPLGRGCCEKNRAAERYVWKKQTGRFPPASVFPMFSCGLGNNVYMEPDGKAFPCYAWCEPEHQLGDLSREGLSDVIKSREMLSCLNHGVDTNRKCRTCRVRYLCGGMCKIWVKDKHDIDSGDFECSQRQTELLEMAAKLDEWEQNLLRDI